MHMEEAKVAKASGMTLFQQKNYPEALAAFTAAEAAFGAAGDEHGRAEMLNNIGVIHRLQRRYEAAMTAMRTAAELFAAAGDLPRQAMTLGNIGDLHAAQKNHDEAARAYSDASELFARAGVPSGQSQVLRALSLLRLRQGQFIAAMVHMEQSLRVKERRGPLQALFLRMLRFALGIFN